MQQGVRQNVFIQTLNLKAQFFYTSVACTLLT